VANTVDVALTRIVEEERLPTITREKRRRADHSPSTPVLSATLPQSDNVRVPVIPGAIAIVSGSLIFIFGSLWVARKEQPDSKPPWRAQRRLAG
jgi:hypothetical protein